MNAELSAEVLLARVRALPARYRRAVREVVAALADEAIDAGAADEDVLALVARLRPDDRRRVQLVLEALEAS